MDESTRLVADLQRKLAELDHKVYQYRSDMVEEFQKYANDLLHDIPQDISSNVSSTIASKFSSYSHLYPPTNAIDSSVNSGTSRVPVADKVNAGGATIDPVQASRRFSNDSELFSRSPHAREAEFRGLFTPSFLPLLDSSSRHNRAAIQDMVSPAIDKGKGKEMDTVEEHVGVDAGTSIIRSLAASPEISRPRKPVRKNTDEVSILSDTSDYPLRSALRTSSNSSAHSPGLPRRVRFEVHGGEVLPGESDPKFEATTAENGILMTEDGFADNDGDAGSFTFGSGEDSPPPKKKLSASEKLRALSRKPLEDDTTWTTVTPPPEELIPEDIDEDGDGNHANFGHIEKVQPAPIAKTSFPGNYLEDQTFEPEPEPEPEYESETEEEIMIAPKRKYASPAASMAPSPSASNFMKPPTIPQSAGRPVKTEPTAIETGIKGTESAQAKVKTVVPGDSKTVEEKYLGDLPFDFDENDGDFEFPLKKNEVLVSEMQEEPESEPETESVTSHDTSGGVALSAYSQSPARHILSRSAQARSQPESDAPISRSKKVNVWHGIFP
ncbi:hypothetical protein B0O99DRAFT_637220, partial [Bisporella sp. PMI_857]